MRKLTDVNLERLVVEHYLFDLEYPVEKVSEILDMDEESVRKISDDYRRLILPEY